MDGATGALGGTSEGRAGTGFAGSSNFGAAAGDGAAAWTAGACGAGAARERAGFAGAEKIGESGARSLGSAGEKRSRENGSRRDGAIFCCGFTGERGCELGAISGETCGAMGFTGAANEGWARLIVKREAGSCLAASAACSFSNFWRR